MVRVDLHTHSVASPDGALTEMHYRKMLAGGLDCIAVTDHNTTKFARELHKKVSDQIIVGEEVTTAQGEIIGLYLTHDIPAGLSALETVQAIKKQNGLVYVPHPFETVRKGITLATLDEIAPFVDIIETKNGRAVFQNKSRQVQAWAAAHKICGAASSDAHGWHGWGKTFSMIEKLPARDSLARLLRTATYHVGSPGLRGVLYPKVNRLQKKIRFGRKGGWL